jgi:NADH:ubiquinone oxidoreductase subunit H
MELKGVRRILIIRAANQAIAFSIPTLAAVVSITAYVGSGNGLDPVSKAWACSWDPRLTEHRNLQALIFTALSYFMLLRQPRE